MDKVLKAALIGALIGGAIDITYAIVVSYFSAGMMPDALLRVIAGGLYGRDIIANGGLALSALGLALHFGIVFVMALLFCVASLSVPVLRRYWYIAGPLYGIGCYVVMNYVVLPMSALAVKNHPEGLRMIGELASHIFGVGLFIGWAARRYIGPAA